MSEERNKLEQWMASPTVQEKMRRSVETHCSDSGASLEEHITRKKAQLHKELSGRILIYLDTKHWVNLCHVVVQSRHLQPIYDRMLGVLELLRQKNRICCPVSSSLFQELMGQADNSTRLATARIMDYLSGGVCLHNWLDLAKAEFGLHICRMYHIQDFPESVFSTWTRVGYWAGEHTFQFPELADKERVMMEKVYWDLRWGMTIEEYQSMPGWVPIPDAFSTGWLEGATLARSLQTRRKQSFSNLVRERRWELLSALKDTLLPMLALCEKMPGSPREHVARVLDPIYEGRDAFALPSLEVVAALDAAITLDTARKPQANDMADYLHAAQALPYCDALFCDNYIAQKARSKPLELGKTYQTEIRSRPEEIVAYLEALA